MTFFLNATRDLRHPEEAQSAVSKDARLPMQLKLRQDYSSADLAAAAESVL